MYTLNLFELLSEIPKISDGVYMFAFGLAKVLGGYGTLHRLITYHAIFLRRKAILERIISLVENLNLLKHSYFDNRSLLVRLVR